MCLSNWRLVGWFAVAWVLGLWLALSTGMYCEILRLHTHINAQQEEIEHARLWIGDLQHDKRELRNVIDLMNIVIRFHEAQPVKPKPVDKEPAA